MKYLLLLLGTFSLAATCNNNKNTQINQSTEKYTVPISGKWTMVSYVAFMPDIPTLSKGDIIWKVDANDNTIAVLMKDPERTQDMGLNTGSYTYKVKGDKITIAGKDYLFSIEEDGIWKLDSNTDPAMSKDRPVMRFSRMDQER